MNLIHRSTNIIPSPRVLLGVLLLLAGCGSDRAPAVAAVTPAVAMPTLVALPTSNEIAASPHSPTSPLRIGEHGDVLLADLSLDTKLLRTIDTLGRVRWQAGRGGEGPGEARLALPLEVTDSSILAFDLATHRLTEWDSAGKLLRTTLPLPRIPLARTRDNEWLGWEPDQPRYGVVVVDADGHTREVLDRAEPQYVEMFPAVSDPRMIVPPALGSWRGGIVVANGKTYQLAFYDWNGVLQRIISRALPPNHLSPRQVDAELGGLAGRPGQRTENQELRRSQLAAQVRPWFTHVTPLGLDDAGRIWVVGQQGDTTFADVFSATQFLGRIVLPCVGFQGRWAMRGEWLALVCAPDDSAAPGDAVVKRWRVGPY
ncbi:MAG: hypothetical protein ABIZ70_15110 [Gemmatimonadales bacterium]